MPALSSTGPRPGLSRSRRMARVARVDKPHTAWNVQCGDDGTSTQLGAIWEDHWSTASKWAKAVPAWGIRILGGVFADDAKWVSRTRSGAQVAAEVTEDYLGFQGGQFNPGKSFFTGGKWVGGDDPGARHFEHCEGCIEVEMVEPS